VLPVFTRSYCFCLQGGSEQDESLIQQTAWFSVPVSRKYLSFVTVPLGVWITLGWILKRLGWGDVDWIGLAKDRNRWRGGMG
jgi:hypothetical protein